MSNYRSGFIKGIKSSGRYTGSKPYRVEYVNRAGEKVNPHNGKPIFGYKPRPKPYVRPSSNKEDGIITAKHRKPLAIKRTGVLFDGLELIPTDPAIDPPPRNCFNCWEPGHKRTNCHKSTMGRFCNNCGRKNEDLNTCPRCKFAHKNWQETLQAKERGENKKIFIKEEDDEIEELNDPDDILQELIYQEQKTREFLERKQRKKRERRNTIDDFLNENEYYNDVGKYVEETETSDHDRTHDFEIDLREQLLEMEKKRDEQRIPKQQERYLSFNVFKEKKSYRNGKEFVPSSSIYIKNRDREYRSKSPEPTKVESNNVQKAMADASSVSNSDPVQDIMLLAKTISHLSSETQDLIMRQVIAERQEQTKRKAENEELYDSPW